MMAGGDVGHPDDVHRTGGLGSAHLLVVDELLVHAGPPPTELGRPRDGRPATVEESPAPPLQDLEVPVFVMALLTGGDDVGCDVLAQPQSQGTTKLVQ